MKLNVPSVRRGAKEEMAQKLLTSTLEKKEAKAKTFCLDDFEKRRSQTVGEARSGDNQSK